MSRDLLLNFGTLSRPISLERLKLLTSNLEFKIDTRNTIQNVKLCEKGMQPMSRDLLLKFGTPYIYPEWEKSDTSNLAYRLIIRGTILKCNIRSRRVWLRSCDPLLQILDTLYIYTKADATNFKLCEQLR